MPSGLLGLLLPVVLSLYLHHLTQKYNSVISVHRREVTPGTATACPDGRQESVMFRGYMEKVFTLPCLAALSTFTGKSVEDFGNIMLEKSLSVALGLLALKLCFIGFCFYRLSYCSEQLLPTIPSLLPLLQESRAKLCINCCSPDPFEHCQSPLVLCEQSRFQYT